MAYQSEEERYPNLRQICGGNITLEQLETFKKAIPEFELFCEMMGRLLAPADDENSGIPDESANSPMRK